MIDFEQVAGQEVENHQMHVGWAATFIRAASTGMTGL